MVVPLRPYERNRSKLTARLNPLVSVAGTTYFAVFQELAAVPRADLVDSVGSAADTRDALVAAVDLVFTGI